MSIAFYLRLSEADEDLGENGKDESNSIENQRMLLERYVDKRKDLEGDIVEYIDDGYSGTNFDRPAFKRMIEDAKRGLIQLILVKDLSRLGRDYITAGDYIEQIFPMLNVQFIAINNGYDSSKFNGGTMGFDMAISNMINTFYSRDLSSKIRAANDIRWKKGIDNSPHVPFGYVKSKEEKWKWEIDPEAAKIVREIFDQALEGHDTSSIATYLNSKHYPTPWRYNKEHHNWTIGKFATKEEEQLWDCCKIRNILRRYEYTGAMVRGKNKVLFIGSRKKVQQPDYKQIIVEGVHEAIVTHEEYEKAVRVIKKRKPNEIYVDSKYPLKGKLVCGNCKRRLTYTETAHKAYFCCRRGKQIGKYSECCKDDYVAEYLENVVFESLKGYVTTLNMLGKQVELETKKSLEFNKQKRQNLEKEISNLKAEKIRLYERYAEDLITREAYIQKKDIMNEMIENLEYQQSMQIEELQENRTILESAINLKSLSSGFCGEQHISAPMVQAFIDKVYVYNAHKIEIAYLYEDEIKKMVESIQSRKG